MESTKTDWLAAAMLRRDYGVGAVRGGTEDAQKAVHLYAEKNALQYIRGFYFKQNAGSVESVESEGTSLERGGVE